MVVLARWRHVCFSTWLYSACPFWSPRREVTILFVAEGVETSPRQTKTRVFPSAGHIAVE